MAVNRTEVNVEPIDAMIQKASNLLEDAQAVGNQYLAHSQNIVGAGWDGPACQASLATAAQVSSDLGQALTAHQELNDLLNKAKNEFLRHQHDSVQDMRSVHPGAVSPAQQM